MISRPMRWFIGLAVIGVLVMAWWARGYPAALTIINTSGSSIENVTVTNGNQKIAIDRLGDGEVRRVSLTPGESLSIRSGNACWQSAAPITPAQAIVVYVLPGPRFEARSRIGTLTR